jgi:hypothetical protein
MIRDTSAVTRGQERGSFSVGALTPKPPPPPAPPLLSSFRPWNLACLALHVVEKVLDVVQEHAVVNYAALPGVGG